MKTFTKQFMLENKGCYEESTLNNCSFMANEPITLESILNSEIKLKDKYWFVCKKLLTKDQNQQLAIGVAEIVLEIYENRHPDNKAPRQAIQTAKDYLAGVIGLDELKSKRAAYAAAYADAAAAAAYAAYAAAYADAAYAAAYAAAAAKQPTVKNFSNILLEYLKDFCDKNVAA